eukprot:18241-Rhodomonas_salina.3
MLKKRAFAFFSTDDRSCYQPRTLLRARYGKPGTDECICYASAEIQLGGVDPASITGEMQLTTTIQPNDYAIPVSLPGAHVHFLSQQINEEQKKRLSSDMGVHSVRFGDVELLQFSNPNLKVPIGCQVRCRPSPRAVPEST